METKIIEGEVHVGWAGELRSLVELAEDANLPGSASELLDYYR